MNILYIVVAVLSVPGTLVLSNLFWLAPREARGVAALLSSPELLQGIVSADFLTDPPIDIARFAQPGVGGYAFNMAAFRYADEMAKRRGRSLLGSTLIVMIIGSGVVGVLAFGWFGLTLPIVNVLILHTTFVGSTQGAIDDAATAKAIERLQVTAVILNRWYAKSPQEVATWLESEPRMKPLGKLITKLPDAVTAPNVE